MKLLEFVSANGETKYAISPTAITFIDDADGAEDKVVLHIGDDTWFAVVGQYDKVVERVNAAIELIAVSS